MFSILCINWIFTFQFKIWSKYIGQPKFFKIKRITVNSLAKLTPAKMGQSCTSFRYCFFETSENDGTLEVQMNPCQTEKKRVENKAIETGLILSISNIKKIHFMCFEKRSLLLTGCSNSKCMK